ncbi:aspartic peptidase domain-containing protein [Cytidiella melzeri]|nr:aspartic peptidase domain-containing protein [Cytidiella melzeri]
MKGVLVAAFVASLLSSGHGASLPSSTSRRAPSSGVSFSTQKMAHRGSSKTQQSTGSPLKDGNDIIYFLDIQLGDQPFTCQIDTGSSDLWVIPSTNPSPPTLVNTTEVAAAISYADGSGVSGVIDFAELLMGGYIIPSQAFINPNQTTNIDQLLAGGDSGMNCLIGLSFDLLSSINDRILSAFGKDVTIGQTPLSNIFAQSPNLPNNLDIHLQRSVDLESTGNGSLLIGEHSNEFGDITKQPVLDTLTDSEWVVTVDAIKVNGVSLDLGTSAIPPLKNTKKVGGLLDSGSSDLILPDATVPLIYHAIPGAFFSQDDGVYVVPCHSSANVSITMGGIEYPVHPLDLTQPQQIELPIGSGGENENATVCVGSIAPVGQDCGDGCDMIMGDVFLRNVIASFNFGNWTQASTPNDGSFIQLLPITNFSSAWPDFITTRTANLKDLPAEPSYAQLQAIFTSNSSTSDSSSSPSTTDNAEHVSTDGSKAALADGGSGGSDDPQLVSLVQKYGPIVIGLLAGNLLIGFALVVTGLVACMRRSGGKARSVSPTYAPVRFKDADSGLDSNYHD